MMTDDFLRFAAYLQTSDTLLEQAYKKEIADTARVLAFHLGHYRTQHEDVGIS